MSGMRILVTDDDPLLRKALRVQLTRAGYEALKADNGQAAWGMSEPEPAWPEPRPGRQPGEDG
jgi:DNA-binding response OmpR family regulator